MLRPLRALAVLLPLASAPLVAQEELTDLFDQGPFYERAGVMRGNGDVPFFADVSFLRGSGDSTQTLLGVALSNSTFQFVKDGAEYRATYEVRLEAEGQGAPVRSEWRETIRVPTFDETAIERETVVFQSAFGLLPGKYDLRIEVRDAQSGETSDAETTLDVPRIEPGPQGYALSEPVLLRFFDPGTGPAGEREYVLYPSHYFESPPEEVGYFVEVYGAPGAQGAQRVTATLVPDDGGPALGTASVDVPPLENGAARLYGRVPGTGLESGLYRLQTTLEGADGSQLAESSTKLSLSAVTQWVHEHWDEAVELLAYEATDEEQDALEEAPPDRRVAAWNEFWEVRDPVPATPGNEAFEDYFRRIAVANANFGTKLRPGWKSDRGQVYVAFGSPNDLIRQPLQSGSFPIEIWVYDNPGFQIVFEDRIGFGNYQMTNPGTFSNELSALERRKHRAIAQRREQLEELRRGGAAEGGDDAAGDDAAGDDDAAPAAADSAAGEDPARPSS